MLKFFKYINIINRGKRIYKSRNINLVKYKNKKKFVVNYMSIFLFLVAILTLVYIYFSKFSLNSLYIGIYIFLGVIVYLLLIEKIRERREIENKLLEIKENQNREHINFLDKIKKIDEERKNEILEIILKNEDGYDIEKWEIGRKSSLLLGKNTVRNKVDIDVSKEEYSILVSRVHGILNRINGVWYYEDLGSQNGSGLEKKSDSQKIKVKPNMPIKVETGDIIYLGVTKLLLK